MALWGSGVQFPSSPPRNMKKFDHTIKLIQNLLKLNGVKMSAIEVRELLRSGSIKADEKIIKNYVNQLRHGEQAY